LKYVVTLIKCLSAASVQSRIKALAKLPHLEAVAEDASLFFKLPVPEELPTPMLQLDGAWFAYDKENSQNDTKWILENVSFSVDLNSRIAVKCIFKILNASFFLIRYAE
jgi:ATPase subunit of ABC transporter with duplicated ATPase domains